ncbi:twin-arginine translocase subunit TatC [Aminivibrio sp.]|jgi:sec-independent protein translocase protein TatC|uniref:twin-arginine translocase subunit TatC n=1 Tax=Aminivibrio sp. TaxID=1872489 RepID=UPI001A5C4AE2|nr:twin-arginine translocase subunit TatC [Aminivibrio sp.]MBL3540253.1 twin-arginine translocase subunit TatC [Aminivibrio sp.]MDK2958379.1 sec-independent protein translocase protein TatC [Synergistaceae bacterium]
MESPDRKNSESYTDHLEVLRGKIISVLAFFCISAVLLFSFASSMAAFLLAPLEGLGVSLYYFRPYEKLLTYMRLAFWGGMVLTAPLALVQGWLFIRPALRRSEAKYLLVGGGIVPVLFAAGSAFAYRVIAPLALRFFLAFGEGDNILPLWGFGEYASFLFSLLLASGLVFQAPLLLLALLLSGAVSLRTVSRLRPWIILFIGLAAALLTPPDVVSQVLLGVPLYLLFELTLAVGRIFIARRDDSG